jgi:hypothetical protein
MTAAGATSKPSPSSARLVGDDVQHLVAWYWCLKACAPGSDIEAVAVEADHSGNLDDVQVTFTDGRRYYAQVKAAVSAVGLANVAWLVDTSRSKTSLFKRLYESWDGLGRPAEGVALITSRPIDPGDDFLAERDHLNRLGRRVRRATGGPVAAVRAELADHIGCTEQDLCEFLDVLEVQLGQTEADWRHKVEDVSLAAGVRTGEDARALAVDYVRNWVKDTRDSKSASDLRAGVDRLGIRTETPRAVLLIEAVDRVPGVSDAAFSLDWLGHLRGDNPNNRRGAIEPDAWNGVLARDLNAARESLKAQGQMAVAVRGAMRLPTWFAVGAELREVANFDVAAFDRGRLWDSSTQTDRPFDVTVALDEPVAVDGAEVALVVEVSNSGREDVRDAFAGRPEIGRLVALNLDGGTDRRAFADGSEVMAAAVAIRDWIRRELRGTPRIHLVLVANGPFALFLGHLWDRVPPTTIYEDLAPGYEPAFRFTN